jgi:hypothetical protein
MRSATHVMAVDGRFCIAVYTIKPIAPGEELCFDYNSVYVIPTGHNSVHAIPFVTILCMLFPLVTTLCMSLQ